MEQSELSPQCAKCDQLLRDWNARLMGCSGRARVLSGGGVEMQALGNDRAGSMGL